MIHLANVLAALGQARSARATRGTRLGAQLAARGLGDSVAAMRGNSAGRGVTACLDLGVLRVQSSDSKLRTSLIHPKVRVIPLSTAGSQTWKITIKIGKSEQLGPRQRLLCQLWSSHAVARDSCRDPWGNCASV